MRKLSILLVFIISLPIWSQADDLAHVAILDYSNNTGSENFSYLSNSISSAVNESMKTKFDFLRLNVKATQAKANALFAKNKAPSNAQVASLAKSTDNDIIIYGYYTHTKASNKISIHTQIYLKEKKKFIKIPPVQNPVDSTIFGAVDRVATTIVDDITKISEQQAAVVDPGKTRKNAKLKITKTSAKEKPRKVEKYLLNDRPLHGGLTLNSNRFWRGRDFFGDAASFVSPWLSYSPVNNLSVRANWQLMTGDVQGIDPDSTFNALLFNVKYNLYWDWDIGWRTNWYYNSNTTLTDATTGATTTVPDLSFMTFYVNYELEYGFDIQVESDYYLSNNGGANKQFGDFYFKLNYGRSITRIDSIGLDVIFNTYLAYYINRRLDDAIATPNIDEGVSGLSDLTVSLTFTRYRLLDKLSTYLDLNASWLPNTKWSSLNAYDQSRFRFWFIFGLSTSI